MTKQLEIERKYLVKFPKSWSDLSELFEDLVDIKRITQAYLKIDSEKQSPRVRKTVEGLTGETKVVYHLNQKKTVSTGVHEEKEVEITKNEYEKYLKKKLSDKFVLEKTRFVFKYEGQIFELDLFKGPLKGLAILEIELKNKNQKVKLPKFLPVIKEVTDDKKYSNFSLANKKD